MSRQSASELRLAVVPTCSAVRLQPLTGAGARQANFLNTTGRDVRAVNHGSITRIEEVVLLALANHEELALDRLLRPQAAPSRRRPAVVDVDAAALRSAASPRPSMPSRRHDVSSSTIASHPSATAPRRTTARSGRPAAARPPTSSRGRRRTASPPPPRPRAPRRRRAPGASPRAPARAARAASRARARSPPRARAIAAASRNVKNFRYRTASRSSAFSQNW